MTLESDWTSVVAVVLVAVGIFAAFIYSLRMGWLPNITSKWINIEWRSAPRSGVGDKDHSDLPPARSVEAVVNDFRGLKVEFSENSLKHIAKLNLNENKLLYLLNEEFKSHVNYFLYDLQDYVMPVQCRYLVHLDKIEKTLTLKAVFTCTKDQARLSTWSDLLRKYRALTRQKFRMGHHIETLAVSDANNAIRRLDDLMAHIGSYYSSYDGLDLQRNTLSAYRNVLELRATGVADEKFREHKLREHWVLLPDTRGVEFSDLDKTTITRFELAKEIALHLSLCVDAYHAARKEVESCDGTLIHDRSTIQEVVTNLELGLQHLHKVLTEFLPCSDSDMIEARHYNAIRPHSAVRYRPLAAEAALPAAEGCPCVNGPMASSWLETVLVRPSIE